MPLCIWEKQQKVASNVDDDDVITDAWGQVLWQTDRSCHGDDDAAVTGAGGWVLWQTDVMVMMMWLQVLGVECCGKLIDAALRLQTGATLAYGDGREATLDTDVHPERVIFKQVNVPAKMYFS